MSLYSFSSSQANLTGFNPWKVCVRKYSWLWTGGSIGFKYAFLLCEHKGCIQSTYKSGWKSVQFFWCLSLWDGCAIQTTTAWANRSWLLLVPMEIAHKVCLRQLKCLIYSVWRHASPKWSAFCIIHHTLEWRHQHSTATKRDSSSRQDE